MENSDLPLEQGNTSNKQYSISFNIPFLDKFVQKLPLHVLKPVHVISLSFFIIVGGLMYLTGSFSDIIMARTYMGFGLFMSFFFVVLHVCKKI